MRKSGLVACPALARFASKDSVFAMGVGKIAGLAAVVHRLDRANHDKMGHDLLDLGETAVEYRGRASQHGSASDELGPLGAGESFFETMTGTARENIRERLVRRSKGVDAKHAVPDHPCRRRRGFVDAKQHHGRLDRDRCDGGRGDPSKTRRAAGGDNMDLGGDTAHRLAKPRPIEALAWHGAWVHASVGEFGHSGHHAPFSSKPSLRGPARRAVALIAKIIL